jgi:putative endonuclease
MKNRKILGNYGEKVAEMFLVKHGFRILALNYRLFFGEIDIIAEKNGIIRFVEVKTVSQETYERGIKPEDHVTREKILKIKKVAEFFLSNNDLFHKASQIDVVAVIRPKDMLHMKPVIYLFENVTNERGL